MKISLGLTTSIPLNRALSLAEFCDKSNFYRIWIGEDISSREIFTYTSLVAMKTKRIRIATGIVSVFTRNPWQIASSAIGLQELCKNRFDLGIGVGGIDELEKLGIEIRNPYRKMKNSYYKIVEYFEIIKKPSWVKNPKIYFGSRGRLLIKLANKIAQGNIFSGPIEYLKKLVKNFKKEKILWNPVVIGDKKRALEIVATMLASTPQEYINFDRNKINRIVDDFKRGRTPDIDEEIIDMFVIYGRDEEELLDKIRELGVIFDEIIVGLPIDKRVVEACSRACSME